MLAIVLPGCAGHKLARHTGVSLVSDELKVDIRSVAPSIVGVLAEIRYEIHKYHYLTRNGQFIPDPQSPVKYKLHATNGDAGISVEYDDQSKTGGGIILQHNKLRSTYTILTSNHLVAPKDTIDFYYLDEEGASTDVLYARYIVKGVKISVRGLSSWRARARVVVRDERRDLAVLQVETTSLLGIEFSNPLGFDQSLSWGDWVFLFGYPKGIKQMTGGWISESPYPNTLAVDAVVRKGFSGGPVFCIRKESGKARLAFVGLVKSVPFSVLNYVTVTEPIAEGQRLQVEDIQHLVVENKRMVDYGTAYFVSPQTIKEFLLVNRPKIEFAGIFLNERYYIDD
ncbi:MAG: serine protease [bacterium]